MENLEMEYREYSDMAGDELRSISSDLLYRKSLEAIEAGDAHAAHRLGMYSVYSQLEEENLAALNA